MWKSFSWQIEFRFSMLLFLCPSGEDEDCNSEDNDNDNDNDDNDGDDEGDDGVAPSKCPSSNWECIWLQ